jgi:hypothetical protein
VAVVRRIFPSDCKSEGCRKRRHNRDAQEALRERFRPADIRILFVGESRPASGHSFYQADSGLHRAMRATFSAASPNLATLGDEQFLPVFRDLGCYLVDLCAEPVDRLAPKARRAACTAGEDDLARMLNELRPKMVISILRSIGPNVERAIARTGHAYPHVNLVYPGRWKHHRIAFRRKLIPTLRRSIAAIAR